MDGQLRLFRKYPLPGDRGTLLLLIMEKNAADDHQVIEALQFYEEFDPQGVLQSKRLLELHFRLTGKEEFEALATDAGFKVKSIYGDYSYSEFNENSSPSMVWILESAG